MVLSVPGWVEDASRNSLFDEAPLEALQPGSALRVTVACADAGLQVDVGCVG